MSFCPQCGTQVQEGTAFCPQCGYAFKNVNGPSGNQDYGYQDQAGANSYQQQEEETNFTRRWQQQHEQQRQQQNAGGAGWQRT